MKPNYLDWLKDEGKITTDEGKSVNCLELQICNEESILDEWAKHFRSNYCAEDEIDKFRAGFGYTRQEYLEFIKFPDKDDKLGRSTRSGDFCELLIADYVEFIMKYYVPRTRYDRKINRNSSPMGSDLMGFKIDGKVLQNDEMIIFEVKAQASESKPQNKLQEAIDHSKKDTKRIAESLNAANQRLIDKGLTKEAEIIQRFQNATDRPYKKKYAAAAVHSEKSFSNVMIKQVSAVGHVDADLFLIVIHSKKLMNFIHELYRRACIC